MSRLKFSIFIIKANPLLYSFLGGVFVSISANVFTGVFGGDTIPERSTQLLAASGLLFFAGSLWMWCGHLVEQLHRKIESEIKILGRSRSDAESEIISGERAPCVIALVAVTFSLIGLLTLIPFAAS